MLDRKECSNRNIGCRNSKGAKPYDSKKKERTDGSRKLQAGTIDFLVHEQAQNKPGFEEGK
jgi:hypothetical protein